MNDFCEGPFASFKDTKDLFESSFLEGKAKEDYVITSPMDLRLPKTGLLKFLSLRSLCIPKTGLNGFSIKETLFPKIINKEKKNAPREYIKEDEVEMVD